MPNTPVSYAKQVNGKLVNIKCHALQVKARGKHKNHLHRSFWLIYELDIDRIIRRISRHNAEMAKRVKEIAFQRQGFGYQRYDYIRTGGDGIEGHQT